TCPPMSRHWAWFPPEVHTDTGRRCSTGSACHPVPRRLRSYAALRLPAPVGRGSGSPCPRPTSMPALVLCPLSGRRHVRPHTLRALEARPPCSGTPGLVEERRGPPRLWDRPLRTCHGRTPRQIHPPPRPEDVSAGGCWCLRVQQDPRHPERREVSGPHALGPHVRLPTHRLPCLHDRRQAGYRLGRAPPWPGRIRTGRTTHKVSWRHRILQFPLTHRAWSHYFSYPCQPSPN